MLSIFGKIYGAITDARNALYRKNIFKSVSLDAPTFSIGNITVGGTGKTPLVAWITEFLAERGEKVCILTRGYGRENARQRVLVSDGREILADARQAGDEPFELSEKLLGKAVIVADANRAAAGKWAREKFGITAFVLDDAFQHRRVRRDLDIVCVDATKPFGNEKVLPAGILREPLKNLRRADVVIITRANLVSDLRELKSKILQLNRRAAVFTAENRITDLVSLRQGDRETRRQGDKERKERIQSSESKVRKPKHEGRFFAFCALGNPDNFFNQMRSENYNLVAAEIFPDHHFYTAKDVVRIENLSRQSRADFLLTTVKDAVKLQKLKFSIPCFVVKTELIFDNEKKLREQINAVFEKQNSKLKG